MDTFSSRISESKILEGDKEGGVRKTHTTDLIFSDYGISNEVP